MDNEYIESLRKQVKKALKADKKRYKHTLGVADTAACLAMRYGVDMQDDYIAGLLHDCAKCVPDEQKLKECKEYNIEISQSEKKSPYLLHSKLGAYYAKHIYNIDNEEICSAIKYHTTGRAKMSMLEKIIFVADYIEPYRNKANDLDTIRSIAFENIDETIYEITKDTLEYLNKKQAEIDPMTVETYEYYKTVLISNACVFMI